MSGSFKLIAAAVLVGLPLGAQATMVDYDFTVTATSGSLAGDVASGSLSFDDSLLAVPNTTYAQTGLLTSLSFTWDGATFNASSANTGLLSSGAAGELALVAFGDNCSAGSCTASSTDPNDWSIAYSFAGKSGRFVYADAAGSYVSSDVALAPIPTPLPGSAPLLGAAVALCFVLLPRSRRGNLRAAGAFVVASAGKKGAR